MGKKTDHSFILAFILIFASCFDSLAMENPEGTTTHSKRTRARSFGIGPLELSNLPTPVEQIKKDSREEFEVTLRLIGMYPDIVPDVAANWDDRKNMGIYRSPRLSPMNSHRELTSPKGSGSFATDPTKKSPRTIDNLPNDESFIDISPRRANRPFPEKHGGICNDASPTNRRCSEGTGTIPRKPPSRTLSANPNDLKVSPGRNIIKSKISPRDPVTWFSPRRPGDQVQKENVPQIDRKPQETGLRRYLSPTNPYLEIASPSLQLTPRTSEISPRIAITEWITEKISSEVDNMNKAIERKFYGIVGLYNEKTVTPIQLFHLQFFKQIHVVLKSEQVTDYLFLKEILKDTFKAPGLFNCFALFYYHATEEPYPNLNPKGKKITGIDPDKLLFETWNYKGEEVSLSLSASKSKAEVIGTSVNYWDQLTANNLELLGVYIRFLMMSINSDIFVRTAIVNADTYNIQLFESLCACYVALSKKSPTNDIYHFWCAECLTKGANYLGGGAYQQALRYMRSTDISKYMCEDDLPWLKKLIEQNEVSLANDDDEINDFNRGERHQKLADLIQIVNTFNNSKKTTLIDPDAGNHYLESAKWFYLRDQKKSENEGLNQIQKWDIPVHVHLLHSADKRAQFGGPDYEVMKMISSECLVHLLKDEGTKQKAKPLFEELLTSGVHDKSNELITLLTDTFHYFEAKQRS